MPDGSRPPLESRGKRRRNDRKRAAAAEAARQASTRLILDPLEPRVLLNADTLAVQLASVAHETQAHDVLVQMVNETVMVGAQSQTVQRVQVVDQTSGGAILAMGDLSEIKAVSIAVPSGADTITIDTNSFGTNAIPKVQVQGDGLTALAIAHTSGNLDWQVNGDGSGGVTGTNVNVAFTGVAAVDGGAGTDTLHGPAADTTWQITGAGAGSLAKTAGGPVTTFQGFESLTGAANNEDTFNLLPGGSMSGVIDVAPEATTRWPLSASRPPTWSPAHPVRVPAPSPWTATPSLTPAWSR